MTGPDVTAAIKPPEEERNLVGPGACRRQAPSGPAHADVSGLDRGAQASYRDDPPGQHRPGPASRGAAGTPGTAGSRRRETPHGRIRVAGIGTAPMSTTGYQDSVEALAVLLTRSGNSDPPAEAA